MRARKGHWAGLLVAGDLCGIVSGLYLASAIRTLLNPLFVEPFNLGMVSTALFPLFLASSILILIFRQLGLYSYERRFQLALTFVQIAKASVLVSVVLIVASFFTIRETYSRSLPLLLLPTSILSITAWRVAVVLAIRSLNRAGYGTERVAVVASDDSAMRLAAKLRRQPALVVCGYIGFGGKDAQPVDLDLAYLGSLEQIGDLIEKYQLSRIVCQDEVRNREQLARLADVCHAAGASFDLVPDFFQFIPHRIHLTDLGGVPLVSIRRVEMGPWDSLVKRVLDVAIAGSLLLVLFPVLLVLTILIAAESPGGVLYRQRRIGAHGRPFAFLKFRSMCFDADQRRPEVTDLNERDGVLFKIRKDPRLTRIGPFIRRYSLDELPQLVNVLRGEMSLVGPRPLPAKDLEKVDRERYGYWFGQRLRVAPGLTGLWQVSGRSDLSFEEMVELDIYYIENWSLTLDFEIMLKTVSEVLSGRGAY